MSARVVIAIVALVVLMIANSAHVKYIERMLEALEREQPSRDFAWPSGPQIFLIRERAVAREYRAAHPDGKLYRYWMATNILGGISLLTWLAIAVTLPE